MFGRRSTVGPEMVAVLFAEARVDAVGEHDEIVARGELGDVVDLGAELELDAEVAGPLVEEEEQRLPRAAAEAVAADAVARALEVDLDVVPVGEFVGDPPGSSPGRSVSKVSRVWSEKTTPKPKVSSIRLRS